MQILFITNSYSGYLVTGPIKAEDCYTFGISVCSSKKVTAIKVNGSLVPVSNYFEHVSSYNKRTNLCVINTKDESGGLIAFATNYIKQPDFWGLDEDGRYGQIDATLIKFKCKTTQ